MFNIFIKLASSTVIAFIVRDRESQRAREPKMVNEKLKAQKVSFKKKKKAQKMINYLLPLEEPVSVSDLG